MTLPPRKHIRVKLEKALLTRLFSDIYGHNAKIHLKVLPKSNPELTMQIEYSHKMWPLAAAAFKPAQPK
jgi:hypothetical protein